jgi:pyruvate dehydrogenase E2 component (dihydrolipoamide acetyltransferase)
VAQIELTVPDIGNFSDVPVIEVLVSPGETIQKDAPLVTLESDKATMEVPATAAGVVRDVKVKVGDKVSQGTVLVTLEGAQEQTPTAPTPPSIPPADAVGSVAAYESGEQEQPRAAAPGATTVESVVDLVVPDIGNFTDVPVIEVLVSPGQTIEKDAPLVTLESEKATMEVPASTGGVIRDLKVKVGDKVSQGSVLATVSTAAPAPAQQAAPAAAAPASKPVPAPPPATNGRPAPPAPPAPAKNGVAAAPPPLPAAPPSGTPVHASPAIRRFARELGVPLARVSGTGPNGRVTRDDVQHYVKSALAAPAGNGAAVHTGTVSGIGLGLPPWPSVDFAKFGPIERVPLSRIKRISGPSLHRNWVMIPHVFQSDEADVTELEEFRKQLNAERKDVKVTMLAFLMKACVAMLQRYPELNASLEGEELVLKRYYNIGYAADTPHGLLVPVIRDADKKGILEIARESAELAAKARDGKLGAEEMSGATFTISSLGSIGGTTFTPIINAPEVAILGAARASIKPVWDGNAFLPRLIQPLTLSYDHRVIDGALGARAVVAIREALSDLRRALL